VGVAVPLKDRRGETRAAIGMTLQAQFWSDEQIHAQLLPALLETAQTLRAVV
jgi:IclR family pca regulon transcriptional regulator